MPLRQAACFPGARAACACAGAIELKSLPEESCSVPIIELAQLKVCPGDGDTWMPNESPNTTSTDPDRHRAWPRWPIARNLRAEINELRQRLKKAEEAASRHSILLREGDHRIKNSLQLVASLMSLQARREPNVAAREALLGAAVRVVSVATIHDTLQEYGGEGVLDLGIALQSACASLQAMAGDAGHVEVEVEVESLKVPVALAQPLILAVTGLVVNALRHAFPGRDDGLVRVSMIHDGRCLHIAVADNGVGLPAGELSGRGYGMQLVHMVTSQIGAELSCETGAGTRFLVRAPYAVTGAHRVERA